MSYQFTFDEQAVYGVKDINRITARLVTAGIADGFEDNGKPYNLCETDSETGATVYQSGVRPSDTSLKAELSEDGNSVTIQPGQAFMGDGTLFTVFLPDPTEDTPNPASDVRLSYTPGVKNYVYIQNDYAFSNSSYPVCSKTPPSGDFVLLAEIEPDGTVTDRRAYAAGKILPQDGKNSRKVCHETASLTVIKNDRPYGSNAAGQHTVNLGAALQDKRYLVISFNNSYKGLGIFDLKNKTYYESIFSHSGVYQPSSSTCLYLDYESPSYCDTAKITVSGSSVTFEFDVRKSYHIWDDTISYPFSFTLL